MMTIRIRSKVHLGCLVLAFILQAEISAAKPLDTTSIDELVATGLAQNAELQSYEAAVAEVKGQRRQANYFKNPNLAFGIGVREVRDNQNVIQGTGTTLNASLLQTFQFPGKGTLKKAIANKNIEIAELGLAQFRLTLASQIKALGYEYLAASTEADAAESVFKQSNEMLTQIGTQSSFGGRKLIENRLIQASLVELGSQIRQSSQKKEEIRTRLNALLGRPQMLPLKISTPLLPPKTVLNDSKLIIDAQNDNPLLRIRKGELERSVRELSATRLDIAPDFAIGPYLSVDNAGSLERNLGGAITANIPVWDWNIGNIESAKARKSAAEALRVKAERDVEAQMLALIRTYSLIQRQITQISPDALPNIQSTSTQAKVEYLNATIGAQLYLDAQTFFLNTLQKSNQATVDAWRTLLDLNILTGGHLEKSPAKKS
jgi:cobalt-zinc-cadmium efflux system outer membrane protein